MEGITTAAQADDCAAHCIAPAPCFLLVLVHSPRAPAASALDTRLNAPVDATPKPRGRPSMRSARWIERPQRGSFDCQSKSSSCGHALPSLQKLCERAVVGVVRILLETWRARSTRRQHVDALVPDCWPTRSVNAPFSLIAS